MDISEYLNRINLKSADTTLFKAEEKEVRLMKDGKESVEKIAGISTYTYCDNGSAGIVGFLRYDKSFPSQVFALNPDILHKMLDLTESIEVEDTFLVGKSKYGEIRKDLVLKKWRRAQATYDNEPLFLKNAIIQRIISTDNIVDSSTITLEGDGKNIVLTMYPTISQGNAKIIIPSSIITSYRLDGGIFMEVIKLLGNSDVKFYLDAVSPEGRKQSPIKVELTDKNAQISYYITSSAEEMSQVAIEKKKTTKKEQNPKETHAEDETETKVDNETKEETEEETEESEESLDVF